jgi:hypothetical protein
VEECRLQLIEIASARGLITYQDLARRLGYGAWNPKLSQYLDAIYTEEVIRHNRPNLSLVVVSAETGLGRYNSRGAPAGSVKVRPNNAQDVADYVYELKRVHDYWAGQAHPTA